jgi:hypothetical protein
MRTTLTIDDDVAAMLMRIRRKGDASLKQLVNEALRRGLREMAVPAKKTKLFRIQSYDAGAMLIPNIDNIAEVLAVVAGEDFK